MGHVAPWHLRARRLMLLRPAQRSNGRHRLLTPKMQADVAGEDAEVSRPGRANIRSDAGDMHQASQPADPRWIRWFPGLQVLRSYDRAWLTRDVFAGFVLTTMLVPVG